MKACKYIKIRYYLPRLRVLGIVANKLSIVSLELGDSTFLT